MTSNRKCPAVVCLAAGKSQQIIIKKAKSLGFTVLAVDRNPSAPGFSLSDEKIVLSTYEAKPIIDKLKELKRRYRLVGVLNRSSGYPVVTASQICQALSLPGVPPDSARTIIDKSEMMAACTIKRISAPSCQSGSSIDDIVVERLQFPCVVKPALSLVGKSGVCIVETESTLAYAFIRAQSFSMNGRVNIEEFVPGYDVVLIAFVRERRLYPIVLLDELNIANEVGDVSGTGFAIPSAFSGKTEESRIVDLARNIVTHFSLHTTPFMMSCRCEPGKEPKLIEIHLDFGGDFILEELIPASTSFDVLKIGIQILIGKIEPPVCLTFRPAAIIYNEQSEKSVSGRSYRIVRRVSGHASLKPTLLAKQRFYYA